MSSFKLHFAHFFQLARPAVVLSRPFQMMLMSLGNRPSKTFSSSSWMSFLAISSLSLTKSCLAVGFLPFRGEAVAGAFLGVFLPDGVSTMPAEPVAAPFVMSLKMFV